jgi:hydrogenase-4 membrane subunit HyfE
VFVGVFIMGIVVFHINREFDSISATRLTELREE